MAEQPIKQFNDDVTDIKQQSLYARLKRLFSTDVIVRNVGGKQLKIKDTDNIMYATDRNSLRDRFNRIRATSYNAYNRDFALSYQAARMDLFRDYDCVGPDTIIPLPDGTTPTISELTERYKDKPQERFWVYSYDHKTDSIKLGKAYHPRKKQGTRVGYKVTFDNGQYVIGSIKHPFMMRDGTYKMIFDLKVGDSVMPFYQKDFYNNGYRSIYNFSKGWQSEHVIIAEQFERPLNDYEIVNHKNFDKTNNLPSNLQIMTDSDHRAFHMHINNNVIWPPENRQKTIEKVQSSNGYKNRKCHKWNGERVGKNNSFYGKSKIVSTLNHKIVSIESIGQIDVYDVTVEEYHNFATDSCFVSNTMDMDPIIASALDIYADECLTLNELKQMIVIHSKNNNIKKILHNLFYDILNIEGNMWSWTRNMCKYGDFYLRLYITPEYGIYMVEPISAYNVERIENADPYNKRYVKFQIRPTDTSQAETVENYEMAHFRLLSDSNFLPYGKAMIEGARRVWKQLSLMEDAMLIHRVMRAPERRIFKVDVGALPPNDVDTFMEKFQNKTKKVPFMDERTGEYNLRFNLQSMVEDYYIPVRGGDSGTEIDTLSGMEWTGIEDLDYIKHKMMAALKIPKAFLGYEEGISGKATLASEDVRFARTIQRIQRILISELSKIAIVHLYAQGYRDESLVDFELELTNPSTIFEREKVEIWSDKVSVASDMIESKLFPKDWIYKNLFNLSEEDKIKVEDQIVDDTKQKYRLTSIEEEGNDPAKPVQQINPGNIDGGSGGGGEGGPDLGPDLGGPAEPGGPEGPGEPGGPEGLQEKAERDQSDRDQSGRKDARDYPFGEDPRGKLEINSSPGTARETNYQPRRTRLGMNEGVSIRPSVDKDIVTNLKSFLNRSLTQEKKELLAENAKEGGIKRNLLDENNIIDE